MSEDILDLIVNERMVDEEIEGEDEGEEVQVLSTSINTPNPTSEKTGEDLIDKAPKETKPVIRNLISNINCGTELNCLDISMKIINAEYNPKKFAAVIFKLNEPKTTNLIFPSGRISCVGAKSVEDAKLALRKVVRILQKIGFKDAKFQGYQIQNILAKTNVGFPIRLEGLAFAHSRYCRFEPEIFPGLVYRMQEPDICLLIYVSGRVVFTGAKDLDDIYIAYEEIYNILQSFKHKKLENVEREKEQEDIIDDGSISSYVRQQKAIKVDDDVLSEIDDDEESEEEDEDDDDDGFMEETDYFRFED